MNKMTSLKKIMNDHRVDESFKFHTHVSMGPFKGKYSFDRDDLEIFWKTYSDNVMNKVEMYIAEKPEQYLPILADIDIKLEQDDDKEYLHTDKQVLETIRIYQEVLKKIVHNCDDEKLNCVVLEKNPYYITKNDTVYMKHGFHLHFPGIILDKMEQEMHIIPRVKQLLKERNVFQELDLDDSGSVIDKACCRVPWLLYGSSKDSKLQPYKVTGIYNSILEKISPEQAFSKYTIYDLDERPISIKGNIEYYFPRILSIIPFGREENELKAGLVSPLKESFLQRDRKEMRQVFDEDEEVQMSEKLDIAKHLLCMLSDNRATEYNEWMTIGWILYNISKGSGQGLNLWCDFSARCSDQYDENVCIFQWDRMLIKDLGMGTLKYYAKMDSPQQYHKFVHNRAEPKLEEFIDGNHYDIATILHIYYGDQFICSSITSKTWYQFVSPKWEQIDSGVTLRNLLSGPVEVKYGKLGGKMYNRTMGANESTQKMIQDKMIQITKLRCRLKNTPYKQNVMREAMDIFYDKTFIDKLDNNPYIFPFKNGIYDLNTNHFRKGRPEDYITKTAAVNYREYKKDDDCVLEVYDFLEKVFPDRSIRTYFMNIASDLFVGGNHQKHVYFLTGDGDNGKSVTQNILEKMLGKLAIKFNTTVLTGKKVNNGAANPELARAGGGVRLATLEEPNTDEVINTGILKNLSGNDTYYARDLFESGKDGREITPMFKLFFICNKLPSLNGADKAVWSRIRVIPFESTFVRDNDPDPAPKDPVEQIKTKRFPMDKNFGRKIPNLLEPFAWVLLEHRRNINTRIEPDAVRAATANYRLKNDMFKQFYEESFIKDEKSKVTIKAIYNYFKEWFRENSPARSMPSKSEVSDYFEKVFYECNTPIKSWTGYRIRTSDDTIVLSDDGGNYQDDDEL